MTTFLDEITLAAEEAMNGGLAGVKWAYQQIAILLGGPIAGDQCYRGENGSWLIRELDEEVGHHETGHAFMACLCRRDPGSIAIFGKSVSGVAGLNGHADTFEEAEADAGRGAVPNDLEQAAAYAAALVRRGRKDPLPEMIKGIARLIGQRHRHAFRQVAGMVVHEKRCAVAAGRRGGFLSSERVTEIIRAVVRQ